MAARRQKKRSKSIGKKTKKVSSSHRPKRAIPAPDTVVKEFTMESGTGKKIRVLRTNQHDPYDANAKSSKEDGRISDRKTTLR